MSPQLQALNPERGTGSGNATHRRNRGGLAGCRKILPATQREGGGNGKKGRVEPARRG